MWVKETQTEWVNETGKRIWWCTDTKAITTEIPFGSDSKTVLVNIKVVKELLDDNGFFVYGPKDFDSLVEMLRERGYTINTLENDQSSRDAFINLYEESLALKQEMWQLSNSLETALYHFRDLYQSYEKALQTIHEDKKIIEADRQQMQTLKNAANEIFTAASKEIARLRKEKETQNVQKDIRSST